MRELFSFEAEEQVAALTAGLLVLERMPTAADQLEACMRAAHSLKGAARIVGLSAGVRIAHVLEDCFVEAQKGRLLARPQIDVLLRGVDLLKAIAASSGSDAADEESSVTDCFLAELAAALEHPVETQPRREDVPNPVAPLDVATPADGSERALRVTAEQLNRVVGVAAESLVESRWLKPFAQSLLRLKRRQHEAIKALSGLHATVPPADGFTRAALEDVRGRILEVESVLSERLAELETYDRRATNVAHRLYDEALACRMRPFADAVVSFPRIVRDLARTLEKEVRLEIVGQTTWLDRDILERLDAPLGHLLRNAVDHGVESPQERSLAGKPAEAVITLEASHHAGMLQIVLSDDGRGIDSGAVRRAVVERNLTTVAVANRLSEVEIFEFLFVPGFSMKGAVTEISGRGVGLDAVKTMLKDVRGNVRVTSHYGKGSRFALSLPLSLSVVRTLLAEVGGEPYAFPLAYIVRTMKLQRDAIESVEGRQLFMFDGRPVGLIGAHRALLGSETQTLPQELAVIVVGESDGIYGIVVDRFLGERELVVHALDARLGKVPNISAGALMEDGAPVLIVDVEDLLRSVEALARSGGHDPLQSANDRATKRKRILIVDDSLTVRELERKLLGNAGYDVELAVNGADGWNAVRASRFDLVVTDIDMPRMDGIELVTLIKADARLRSLPVMIVSYKDRDEDRRRGLDAGADHFLSKSSFHDETLLQAAIDLIGGAGE